MKIVIIGILLSLAFSIDFNILGIFPNLSGIRDQLMVNNIRQTLKNYGINSADTDTIITEIRPLFLNNKDFKDLVTCISVDEPNVNNCNDSINNTHVNCCYVKSTARSLDICLPLTPNIKRMFNRLPDFAVSCK